MTTASDSPVTNTNDRLIFFALGVAVMMSFWAVIESRDTNKLIIQSKGVTHAWAATVKAECGKYGIELPDYPTTETD